MPPDTLPDLARAELLLRQLQRIVEFAPTGFVSIDEQGVIQFVNKMTEALFGYSSHELIGQPVEVLIPESARALHIELRQQFMSAPQPRKMGAGRNVRGVRKDGIEIPLEIWLAGVQTETGMLGIASVVDLSTRSEHTLDGEVEIVAPSGWRIRVSHSVDTATLKRLIQVLHEVG